ncbi:hypothetical protein [Saccharothrix xinjiangensis]|uniref:Uncharacterized protein n=1 Tax=Saccharothrix xinjiangensis TaxID=204798 RepID=A0ABV9XZL9_9PSEU
MADQHRFDASRRVQLGRIRDTWLRTVGSQMCNSISIFRLFNLRGAGFILIGGLFAASPRSWCRRAPRAAACLLRSSMSAAAVFAAQACAAGSGSAGSLSSVVPVSFYVRQVVVGDVGRAGVRRAAREPGSPRP